MRFGSLIEQIKLSLAAIVLIFIAAILLFIPVNAQPPYQKEDKGIVIPLEGAKLKIQVYAPNIIRVLYTPGDAIKLRKSLVVEKTPKDSRCKVLQQGEEILMKTARLQLQIDAKTGAIQFLDKAGKILLGEAPDNPRTMTSARVMGEETWHALQRFVLTPDEGIYGLGQHQDGYMNYRGKDVCLIQTNPVAVNPFLISTNGYGILWDNYSKTLFHDSTNGMSFWSEVAEVIDYYFISGETMDEVIAGYRVLTGQAPLFGKWAYGYWQSKERYLDADDILSVAKEYRERKIPIDNIVQDWRYWGENDYWSSMRFDNKVYPDPEKTISAIHNDYDLHYMISIWPALGIKTDIYKEMKAKGHLYPPQHWTTGYVYDAYSREARDIYWRYVKEGLVSKGVDALWMDATEPELGDQHTPEISEKSIKEFGMTELGTMARYLNTYSLMTAKGVYEGFRKDFPQKRAFILTRSAFSGQQRYAAATWSGDISSNYDVFRKQISAGVNFCLAGIPYWTHDIGAFFPSWRGGLYPLGCKDPAYQELYVRWFQFGAFTPIFRSHGTGTPREVWRFGEPGYWAYDTLVKFDNLRYRLLPYIYSLAWKVTSQAYTIMRGLPMDFTADKNTYGIDNQYMFGPSLLVTPVTEEMYHKVKKSGEAIPSKNLVAPQGEPGILLPEYIKGADLGEKEEEAIKSVNVYLPQWPGWYDFWTGDLYQGGQKIRKETPVDIMPLYVRAGSILPLGPFKQYSTEKPEDPLELRIYAGADCEFELYEDENDNYNYEKGVYASIPFKWDEKSKTLTIGKRKGSFPGMLKKRTFRIVWVQKNHGVGLEVTKDADQTVTYSGKTIRIRR